MTDSRTATHQLLRLLGGSSLITTDDKRNRYDVIVQQILGALQVINWLGLADDEQHRPIFMTALHLRSEEERRAFRMKYLIGVEVGTRVKQ